MNNLMASIGGWRENWPRIRQAIQTTIAACLAYMAIGIFGLPQGFWAVVTAILVMQANVGASLGLAFDRLLGSLLGALVGGAVALVAGNEPVLKFTGLAATVFVLGFFSARRPTLRIASVTAAIVILGDPRFGPPVSSAGYRMVEVLIGAVIAILTMLVVFPARAGPALADHVARTLPLYFELLSDILTAALTGHFDLEAARPTNAKIRAALVKSEALATEARREVAGFLADHPDPEAILRSLRRLWHTEVMLTRAVSAPLPATAVAVMRPALEQLRDAIEALPVQFDESEDPPSLKAVEDSLTAVEQAMSDMRAKGELRSLPMDEVIRLLAFDFALDQLRQNLKDLADRRKDVAGIAGSTIPWIRKLGWARNV